MKRCPIVIALKPTTPSLDDIQQERLDRIAVFRSPGSGLDCILNPSSPGVIPDVDAVGGMFARQKTEGQFVAAAESKCQSTLVSLSQLGPC